MYLDDYRPGKLKISVGGTLYTIRNDNRGDIFNVRFQPVLCDF